MNTSPLSMKTKIGYGIGDLASNLLFQLTVIYLLFFYTDIVGIAPATAGVIFIIARLWDAINDPIMGLIMDRTRSKHGKARVYILYGSLPLALSTIAMFYVPNFLGSGKAIYACITYVIWGMLFTLVNIPYSSLTASLTQDPQERTSLSSIRMMFMLVGVIIVSVATEPIVSLFESKSTGYFALTMGYGLLSWIFFLLCFKWTKVASLQDKDKQVKEKYTMKNILPILLQNKQLIIVTLASLVGNIAVFIRETAAIYYVNYNVGNSGLLPIFLGIVVLSMFAANLLIPFATRKWDKKGTYIIGSCIGIIGSIVFHYIPSNQLELVLLFAAISSFGMAAISTLGWAMIADTIEYGQWKTGVRSEGISYALYSFSQKLATAISGGLVAFVLSISGYNADFDVQHSKTLLGILSTLTIIPIVFIAGSILIILGYKINRTFFEKIQRELK